MGIKPLRVRSDPKSGGKKHFISMGPAIPIVPMSHFSKTKLTREQLEGIWQIVGPSVERNLVKVGYHLWILFCFCYLEGLEHGYQLSKDEEDGHE